MDKRNRGRSVRAQLLSPAMLVALLALVLAAGGVTYAAIPDAQGTITACTDNKSGLLRAIDKEAGATCRSNETELSWNKQGVPGLELVTAASAVNSVSPKTAIALCPPGKRVLGGGAEILGGGLGIPPDGTHYVNLTDAFPQFGLGSYVASANEQQPFGDDWGLTAYAICASVS
jgi:hypothetical protein